MPAVGEHDVGLLKRQLQVLNYQDSLDTSSYELVKKLVADLVHTTETYQSLKQQCGEQQQEIASFRSKVSLIYDLNTAAELQESTSKFLDCRSKLSRLIHHGLCGRTMHCTHNSFGGMTSLMLSRQHIING